MSKAWKAYKRILRDYLDGLKATRDALAEFVIGLAWLTLPITFWAAWPIYHLWLKAKRYARKN